jgi:hypothetical protein
MRLCAMVQYHPSRIIQLGHVRILPAVDLLRIRPPLRQVDAKPMGVVATLAVSTKSIKKQVRNTSPISRHMCNASPQTSVHTSCAQGSGKRPQTQSPGFLTGKSRASFG